MNLRYCLFSDVNQGNEKLGLLQYFIVSPQGFERFPSDLSQAGWRDLVCVECL